jgi:hypothetical protein
MLQSEQVSVGEKAVDVCHSNGYPRLLSFNNKVLFRLWSVMICVTDLQKYSKTSLFMDSTYAMLFT